MSDLGNKEVMADNIDFYLKKNSLTRKQMADDLDISYTTLSTWLQGKAYPRIDKIEMMANYFGVSKADLVEQHKNKKLSSNVEYLYSSGKILVKVPIIGTIACGEPITAEQNVDGYTTQLFTTRPSGTLFALKANGRSMEPTIPDGSTVIVREQPEVEDGEIAAVEMPGEDDHDVATLKRVKHVDGAVLLMPDNQSFPPIILNEKSHARIIGKAIRIEINL
jgi:repressor LexA